MPEHGTLAPYCDSGLALPEGFWGRSKSQFYKGANDSQVFFCRFFRKTEKTPIFPASPPD
jgi:hypothetical protein